MLLPQRCLFTPFLYYCLNSLSFTPFFQWWCGNKILNYTPLLVLTNYIYYFDHWHSIYNCFIWLNFHVLLKKWQDDSNVSSDDNDDDDGENNKVPYWITDKNIFKDSNNIEFLSIKEKVRAITFLNETWFWNKILIN